MDTKECCTRRCRYYYHWIFSVLLLYLLVNTIEADNPTTPSSPSNFRNNNNNNNNLRDNEPNFNATLGGDEEDNPLAPRKLQTKSQRGPPNNNNNNKNVKVSNKATGSIVFRRSLPATGYHVEIPVRDRANAKLTFRAIVQEERPGRTIEKVKIRVRVNGGDYTKYDAQYVGDASDANGDLPVWSITLSNIPMGTIDWQIWAKNTMEETEQSELYTFLVTEERPIVHGLQADCFENDKTRFNICLDLKSTSGRYQNWMESFGDARNRWQKVITGDDGPPVSGTSLGGSASFATQQPDSIDDLYIAGIETQIDGAGGVLGSATPTHARVIQGGKLHAVAGIMRFDSEDIANMMNQGLWEDVILHEMGHVLGIGPLWENHGLHQGGPNSDRYLGHYANLEWSKLGCPYGSLPVEMDGSAGTAGVHWDDLCLGRELMTGYISRGNKLSSITVGSLQDMGYTVSYDEAEPFNLDGNDCSRYCPNPRRNLRASKSHKPSKKSSTIASPIASNPLTNDGANHARPARRALSTEGRQKALRVAANDLQKLREEAPAVKNHLDGLDPPSQEEWHPDQIINIAGNFMTVYVEEEGEIFDETISWEEAKNYVSEPPSSNSDAAANAISNTNATVTSEGNSDGTNANSILDNYYDASFSNNNNTTSEVETGYNRSMDAPLVNNVFDPQQEFNEGDKTVETNNDGDEDDIWDDEMWDNDSYDEKSMTLS